MIKNLPLSLDCSQKYVYLVGIQLMRRFLRDIELRMMLFPMNINNSSLCFLLLLLNLVLLEKC